MWWTKSSNYAAPAVLIRHNGGHCPIRALEAPSAPPYAMHHKMPKNSRAPPPHFKNIYPIPIAFGALHCPENEICRTRTAGTLAMEKTLRRARVVVGIGKKPNKRSRLRKAIRITCPSAKRKTQNAKRKTQNAKHKNSPT